MEKIIIFLPLLAALVSGFFGGKIAKILAEGHPVARFSLKSHEFGPRALGNRSILADPRNQESINIINKYIKVRDFWMPFAPSVLEEDANKIMHVI